MKKIFKRFNTLGILVLLTLVSLPYSFAQVEGLRLRVDGIACPFCAYGLEKKLRSLEGVESLDISLKQGTVEMMFKKDNNVDLTKIKTMVKDAGYTLRDMTITALGAISKEGEYFLFNIEGNQNKLYIFDGHAQLEAVLKDKTLIKITGSVHSHPDGSFGLSVKEYSVEEDKK